MSPRRALPAFIVFALLFYVLPVQAVLRDACTPLIADLPTLGLGGLPWRLHLEVNLHFMLLLMLAYGLIFGLVALLLRLLQAFHADKTRHRLAKVTSIKDLHGMDTMLGYLSGVAAVGLTLAVPFWESEGAAVLAGLACLSLAANGASQPAKAVPSRKPGLLSPRSPDHPADGDVRKLYTWHYSSQARWGRSVGHARLAVELLLSHARYAEYRECPRVRNPRRWDRYITAPAPEVEILAGKLLAIGQERGFGFLEMVCHTLAFTQQCIHCVTEGTSESAVRTDLPKYPIESLMEECGSRDERAILTAALLQRMGYGVALLLCPGHTAVGVAGAEGLPGAFVIDPLTRVRYFYTETTADGWHVGELPDELAPHLAQGEFEIVPVLLEAGR